MASKGRLGDKGIGKRSRIEEWDESISLMCMDTDWHGVIEEKYGGRGGILRWCEL